MAFSDAEIDSDLLHYCSLKWFEKKTEALQREQHDQFQQEMGYV